MILSTYFFELIAIFSTMSLIFPAKLVNVIFSNKEKSSAQKFSSKGPKNLK